MTVYLPAGWTPAKAAAKWKVGFSQCTTLEPWRVQFNKDIEAEAKNHPEVQLIITDGQDKTEKQVADCENLIVQQVDVLLDLAEGIGRPDGRRRKGDRRQDPGDRARPQRRHQAHHPVHRRRQCADRQGRRRIRGEAARRRRQGAGQRRRDLGRHGHRSRRTTATTASTPSPTRSPGSSICSTTSPATGSRIRPTTS